MTIRIVAADDHPIVLDGLERLFGLEPDLEIAARCVRGSEVLEAVERLKPDVLVLDLRMPGNEDLAVLRELRRLRCPSAIVLLAAEIGQEQLLEAMRLGVRGVVLKEMAPQMLVRCIRKVHAGERWIEKESFGRAMERLLNREQGTRDIYEQLSPREVEIVRLVAQGLRNRELGQRLGIQEGTVKNHLHSIYEKLGVESRTALLALAHSKGLI